MATSRAATSRAVQDQPASSYTPPTGLTTLADWQADQDRNGGRTRPGARAYAAIVYLTEQYGFPAVVALLTGNHDGNLRQFQVAFRALTGADTAGFEVTLAVWLATAPKPAQATAGNGAQVQVTLSPGGGFAEARVRFTTAVRCAAGGAIAAGTEATFTLSASDTGLSGVGYVDDATITLSAQVREGALSGTLSYTNASNSARCDSGPIAFGS